MNPLLTGGSRPTFGSQALTFESPKPVKLDSILALYALVAKLYFFCFVSLQLPIVENH